MIRDNFKEVKDQVSQEDRFVSSVAALLYNLDAEQAGKKFEKGKVLDLLGQVDELINVQMNEILHNEKFQKVEAVWRGLDDLVQQHTNFRANISIDMLDVGEGRAVPGLREQLEQHLRRCAVREDLHQGVRPVRWPSVRRHGGSVRV